MRDGVNLGRLPDGLICVEASLRVDEVRRKYGVDKRRLSETRLTCIHVAGVNNPAGVSVNAIGAHQRR